MSPTVEGHGETLKENNKVKSNRHTHKHMHETNMQKHTIIVYTNIGRLGKRAKRTRKWVFKIHCPSLPSV